MHAAANANAAAVAYIKKSRPQIKAPHPFGYLSRNIPKNNGVQERAPVMSDTRTILNIFTVFIISKNTWDLNVFKEIFFNCYPQPITLTGQHYTKRSNTRSGDRT